MPVSHDPSVDFGSHTGPELGELARRGAVVVLPVASTEQHGPALPANTDSSLVTAVARSAASRFAGRVEVLVAPTLCFGASHHHVALGGTISLTVGTFQQVILDVVESLHQDGFGKILVLNGHGGNWAPLSAAVATLAIERGIAVAATSYWTLVGERVNEIRESEAGGMAHAGEFETSMQLYLNREQVRKDRLRSVRPRDPSPYVTTDLFVGSRVFYPRTMRQVTGDAGMIGEATLASREKGERLFEICVEEVAAFLEDFSRWG